MKLVSIILKQGSAEHPGTYIVARLENTVELSIGQRAQRRNVAEWCCMARVKVAIVGVEDSEAEDGLLSEFKPELADKTECVKPVVLLKGQQSLI